MVLDTKMVPGKHNTFSKNRDTHIDPSNDNNTDIEKIKILDQAECSLLLPISNEKYKYT